MTRNAPAVAGIMVSLLFASLARAEDRAASQGGMADRHGHNYQPTSRELRAMERQDVLPIRAREINVCTMSSRQRARRLAGNIQRRTESRSEGE